MNIQVSFPGGMAVDANVGGHVVHTDQPEPLGLGSAPSPFDLLLASIATCMGFYALRFCQERNIPTRGLALDLDRDNDRIRVSLQLPPEFPAKYADAIQRAVDHCAVKRQMLNPPKFEISLEH